MLDVILGFLASAGSWIVSNASALIGWLAKFASDIIQWVIRLFGG